VTRTTDKGKFGSSISDGKKEVAGGKGEQNRKNVGKLSKDALVVVTWMCEYLRPEVGLKNVAPKSGAALR
jgi:hypothetical protein